jgi:CIC family chloride channel protein
MCYANQSVERWRLMKPSQAALPPSPDRPAGASGRLRAFVRSSELALTLTAALVGAAAGLVVFLMSRTVQWTHADLFGIDLNERLSGAAHIAPAAVLVWPTAGGLLLGLLVWIRRRRGRPPSVDPIEANALHGGRMSIADSLVVGLQTLISNGFGASVGLEAGYTQAGSGVASALGVRLKLRRSDLRVLVGAGAAGAIAAAFAAPLTGAFYGFEVVIGAYTIANVAPVMAAAIAGALVTQEIGGSLYHIEASSTAAIHGLDYVVFTALGVVCAALAITWMRSVSALERVFTQPFLPAPLRPAMGGLIVGGLALTTPQVLSAGHGALQFDLTSALGLQLVVYLLAAKMLASAVSLGSGFRGGLFFASLLVGALTGMAFARVLNLTGWVQLDQTSAALVGMGAFAVAVVGGPLTMSFLVLETTADYALTGAVLAASVMASLIVREAFGYSFSTFRLHLRGESIRSAHDVGWIRSLTVGRLMRRDPPTAPAATPLTDLRHRFPLGSTPWIVLLDDQGGYAGMAALAEAYAPDADETAPSSSLARFTDCALTAAMNVKQALALFDRVEAESLAVVDSADDRRVMGLLNETFAVRRYAEELDKSRRELIGEPDL